MCYMMIHIFIAIIFIIFFSLLISLTSKNTPHLLPWNWPLVKLLPTAYLKSHELYDRLTQVLADNNSTILCKTSSYTNIDILVTSDPCNVHHVMNSNPSIYQRGSEFRKALDFLGDAVFIKDLDEWKQGKKFTHGFYKEAEFHNSTPKIIRHTLEKGLIPTLLHMSEKGENRVFDLQEMFSRFMIDATCLMATGFDLASLRVGFPHCPLLEAMDDMGEAVFWRNVLPERVWKLQRWLGMGKEKKMAEACIVLDRVLDGFVVRKKQELTSFNQTGDDNFDHCNRKFEPDFDVLKFYMSSGDGSCSKKFLAANIMTLLFAGRDTSAALLTWFFHLISTNPNSKNVILEELNRNFPPEKHLFADAEELSKLVYLHCALTESLRLFPTAPVIIRDPTAEDVLPSGHRVGKSTKIILCSYAMGRSPEIWGEDCSEFRPERWMSERGGVRHVASHRFLAFGSGLWACPGRELAFTRMKAAAATVLHNFGVEVLEGQRVSPSVSALLTMKHGLKARVSSRWL
ncbi:hypothetical protein C2S53_009657 [Perilla frutescens var. hirtella]|uniref:Cytochrome P450 n=1 Tax=Perilla frutescens var. hirtella TaxID=608512 RepID=A0AAD4JH90_PERFH|nr:hypothetical protein C2S53_009657 [Perilla frutescens var. hirtella]